MSNKTRWRNDVAEQALLGRCLLEPMAYDAASDLVAASDFYTPPFAFAWEAMGCVRSSRREITEAAIEDELTRRKRNTICGVPKSFASWIDAAGRVRDVQDAAGIVSRNAAARRTIDAAHDVLDFAERDSTDAEQLASFAVSKIAAAADATSDVHAVDLSDELEQFFVDIEKRANAPGPTGPTTGLAPLDDILVSLDPAIYLLGAGTGVGKTTLATNITMNVAAQRRGSVLYLSLEMMNAQLVRRIVAGRTGINARAFRLANLTAEQMGRTGEAIQSIYTLPVRLVDRTDVTAAQIRALGRREACRGPLAMIVVDHIGLIAPSKQGRRDVNREREVAEIVWSLKVIANELRVPVLALVQLNRGPDQQQRRPRLSDLRDSGTLEQTAEAVIFLHREKNGDVTCFVPKNRNDRFDTEFTMKLDGATSTFTSSDDKPRAPAMRNDVRELEPHEEF